MQEQRAKLLIRLLAQHKVDTLVGVQTFSGTPPHATPDGTLVPGTPSGSDEWNVMMAPGQVIPVTEVAMALHFHGFNMLYGPQEGPDGSSTDRFAILDSLPTMIPEAQEVEVLHPDDLYRSPVHDGEGELRGWRVNSYSAGSRKPGEAKTGGEGLWTPGP